MKELETLLNSLIKMGWKPFGMEIHAEYIDRIIVEGSTMHIIFKGDGEYIEGLRTLVSHESGLWRFVVENKLYKKTNIVYEKHFGIGEYKNFHDVHYQYRLLESALIPEEDLVEFLLENINIEG